MAAPASSADNHPVDTITTDFDPGLVRRFASTATTVLRSHASNLDAVTILRRLCDDVVTTMDGAGATVLLHDPETGGLRSVAAVGWAGEEGLAGAGIDADDDSNCFAAALYADHAMIVADVNEWASPSPTRQRATDAGIASIWIAPLRDADDQPLGTFSVSWTQPHPTTDEQHWVFEEFATLAQMIVELHKAQWHRMAMIARERNRIAGELHDDSVQAMTAVSLRLQRLSIHAGAEHRPDLMTARAEVDGAIDRLRHMMFSLHSDTLAEEGLVVSLSIYLETYVEVNEIAVEIVGDEELRLPDEVEALAFRLARSALLNVVKHAHASRVRVAVTMHPRAVEVRIRDDGVGFNPAAAALSDHPGHFGLAYARSLATSVGGTYSITSSPGTGTDVEFHLPIL